MQEQCQRILAKVAEAHVRYMAGSLGKVDGADDHQFEFQSPLTEDELAACEAKTFVKLPAEFRAFLLSVGRSGAGPNHGIFRSNTPIGWWLNEYCLTEEPPSSLSYQMPCQLREALEGNWIFDRFGPDWYWPDTYDENMDPFVGTMSLVYYGGAQFDVLILNGPYTGRVCWIDQQVDDGYSPPPVFAPEANFLDWYEAWIDLVLTGADVNYGLRLARASAAMEKNDG